VFVATDTVYVSARDPVQESIGCRSTNVAVSAGDDNAISGVLALLVSNWKGPATVEPALLLAVTLQ
jgi:hypothetical protein